jgi:hypothetical protein
VLNIYAGGSAGYGALARRWRSSEKRLSEVCVSKEQAVDSQQGDIYWPVHKE